MSQSTKKHPKALPYLFLTEMWERFGYYLMLGIFVLYLTDVDTGGFAIDNKKADEIFGTFIALTYLTPFLGGFIADRVLGYVKSIYIGGVLMGIGYIGLSIKDLNMFYLSMALIIIGNGFFKPSISTLLGNLYSTDEYRANKDSGYNIFYMGINIGAFVCNIIAAFMRNSFGWGAAFVTAGIGMFVGLVIFTFALKDVKEANVMKPKQPGEEKTYLILGVVFLLSLIFGALGWFYAGTDNLFGSDSTDAFIAACIPVIGFFIYIYKSAESHEKKPISVLLTIFAVSMMFWAIFKQNGTALTRWANYYTNRTVTGSVADVLTPIKMVKEIKTTEEVVTQYDNEFNAIKENGSPVKAVGRDVYFKNAPEQIDPSGKPIQTINTELFQSINPGWVIALTPVVVLFFALLARRKREPTTPSKIAWGLVISAVSTLVMVGAVMASNNGANKVSALWLVGCYGVITIGELFLSPMGLSLVSKLSPPRITALMMGGLFLSISIGNKLSGVLASTWYNYENKANYFYVNFALLIASAILAFSLLGWMNKIFKEYMK